MIKRIRIVNFLKIIIDEKQMLNSLKALGNNTQSLIV